MAGPRRVMAVVKADAYGHGAVTIARTLAEAGADWFGVATVEEGLELRAAGVEQPILLLGGLYMSDPADLIEHGLTPTAFLHGPPGHLFRMRAPLGQAHRVPPEGGHGNGSPGLAARPPEGVCSSTTANSRAWK